MTDLSHAVRILASLEANNSKDWFEAHKSEIDAELLVPCRAAADELRQILESECRSSLAAKFYRLNRDLRFSKDKTPYNTHFRFSLWQLNARQEDSVCFHFSVEKARLTCGVGLWEFKDRVDDFRARCSQIEGLLTTEMRLSEPELKRVPTGLTPSAELSEHFRRKGLAVWIDSEHDKEEPVCFDLGKVASLVPIYGWLKSLAGTSGNGESS